MLWQELIKVALMGTERAQISTTTKAELRRLGIDPELPAPQLVLEGAAYLATMHKSGIQAPEWTQALPTPAPLGTLESDCSPKAIRILQQILDDTFPKALEEFVQLLHQYNRQLPAEMLPELFNQSRQNPELWAKLKDCIGARGQWLLQQNPDWQSLREVPDENNWEYGTRTERQALVRYWRQEQPDYGRERVLETWKDEDSKTRIALIPLFKIGLGPNDESFLEQALEDKRKEVRKKAAELLALLPESALVQRMQERVLALFEEASQGEDYSFEIQVPGKLSPPMLRDGLDPQLRSYPGGVKASRLGQMLAIIPPSFWETHFQDTPAEVLALFLESNWPNLCFIALSQATIRHRNEVWMETLIEFWLQHHFESEWQNIDLEAMIPILPPKLFNKMALRGLTLDDPLASSTAPISILLQHAEQSWDDELTYAFFRQLKEWFQQNPGQYWSTWHFWNILGKAAYLIDPKLWPTLQKAFDQDPIWYQASTEIDKFMNILRFRDQMQKSLSSDP